MSPDNEKGAPGSPAQWLTHAESDLRLARISEIDVEEVLQTAEKTLSWASELISRKEGENP